MQYKHTVKGSFIERPNRFIARVSVGGKVETVHVKNTGRCRELLFPGVAVILEESMNPNRKTKYDLVTVYKEGIGWVNIDSQAPNQVVKEWLLAEDDTYALFKGITYCKPEYTYGQSRIDFYLEQGTEKVLMEVKGVTLEQDGIGYFPDAPTERGIKHIKELTKAAAEGYTCYLAFVIQMEGVDVVYPNDATHKAFGEALEEAVNAGVGILYLGCQVTEDSLQIRRIQKKSR